MSADSYRYGYALGHEYADADRANSEPLGSSADELRAEAREALCGESRSWAAFKLGVVRGYRDAVRTLRGGRWGT